MTSAATPSPTSRTSKGRLKPGAVVRCRTRRYLVEDVQRPESKGGDTLVTLACMEDDAIGQRLTVFQEQEIDFELLGESSWEDVASRGFDRPAQFAAYLNTLRWNCVTATDAELFQAPYRAGIEVKAYQLEPLRKALQQPRLSLFIADDVGLGKTIEAGLILRELLLRQRIRRVVVSCPPSVVRQWQEEMQNRFGLAFTVMDRAYMAQVRRERGYSTNPWSTHSRFLISHSLLREETYAAPLRDWLDAGDGETATPALLILDEAHNAAPASNSLCYAVDSRFTRALRDLAPRFEHRLFLSATPHNGHSNSFSALLELLDPTRFCRGVPVRQADLDAVLVRRLKDDLRRVGEEFPERRVEPIALKDLPDDQPELQLSRLLQEYRQLRLQRLASSGASKRQQTSELLVLTNLQKRLLSSPEAFASTLRVHRRHAEEKRQQRRQQQQASLDLLRDGLDSDSDWADLPEDDVLSLEAAQLRTALAETLAADQEEQALLDQMSAIAEKARRLPDARIQHLLDWIRQHLCRNLGEAHANWEPTRLLIFTDYVDTKRYLEQQLRQVLGDEADDRLASFTGGMAEDTREQLKAAFNSDPADNPLRILIATDAAREGVNLQNYCHTLIHFDIPWNPSKLEQRNGRIDRKLQRSPVVHCHYYVLPQRAEDRVLEVLVKKTETIRQELGSLSPLVQRRVDQLFSNGIDVASSSQLVAELDAIDQAGSDTGALVATAKAELEAGRRVEMLKQQQETLRALLDKSRRWLQFSHDPFRQALECSLDLMGITGLVPTVDEKGSPCWRLDDLERLQQQDRSWAQTLDSLRGKSWDRRQPLWEWRQENPLQPVIFSDPGRLNASSIHLHLEHRLVQRLLSRFLSQGFLNHELNRACVVASRDPIPKLVVLGRLSLFGEGASRLHDEIVSVAAAWSDPQQRQQGLTALNEAEQVRVWAELQEALSDPARPAVSAQQQDYLRAASAADIAELRPVLEAQAETARVEATALLTERGRSEATALRSVLREQERRIQATLKQRSRELDKLQEKANLQTASGLIPGLVEQLPELQALQLHKLGKQEEKQLLSDQKHWQRRLEAIAQEREDGPAQIQRSYQVKTHRIEPVGLIYLWPITG
ncbi:DISARM system SNF2-like helicase DrmD [Synechococcus elongatus]|uniref:DISARM system SNF2-like helicase DrmD n=1 Tax=Synechococcus elongatus TaxID=32046 RepID=UPI003CC8C25D